MGLEGFLLIIDCQFLFALGHVIKRVLIDGLIVQ